MVEHLYADEISPMTEEQWNRILETIKKIEADSPWTILSNKMEATDE